MSSLTEEYSLYSLKQKLILGITVFVKNISLFHENILVYPKKDT